MIDEKTEQKKLVQWLRLNKYLFFAPSNENVHSFISPKISMILENKAKEMGKLQVWLEKWNPTIFPAFVPSVGGKSILHMLISMSPKAWPDEELRNILVSLPPEFTVSVHPESLL